MIAPVTVFDSSVHVWAVSVAWNLRLPYLYSSAVPGREWQDYPISPLLGRERSWHVREKSAWFAYLPTLPRYLLKESPPSPVIRPPPKNKNRNIAASTSTSKQHRSIRAYNSHKQVPQQLNQKLLSAQPTYLATHVVQKNTLSDLRHASCLLQNTHIKSTIELYSDSTSSTPELSQAPLANLLSLGLASYLVCDVGRGISQQQQQQQLSFSNLKKKGRQPSHPRRQSRKGIFQ